MNWLRALNGDACAAVESRMLRAHRATSLLIAGCLLAAAGCVDISSGGAVELSWSFQTFRGEPIPGDDCEGANIESIDLTWEPAPGADIGPGSTTTFLCTLYRGITDFEIPEGPQLLSITPVCGGAVQPAANRYEVPAPILRNVLEGQVATLDSLLIVVDVVGDPNSPDCACCDPGAQAGTPTDRQPW